jgi:hypothetical protein
MKFSKFSAGVRYNAVIWNTGISHICLRQFFFACLGVSFLVGHYLVVTVEKLIYPTCSLVCSVSLSFDASSSILTNTSAVVRY